MSTQKDKTAVWYWFEKLNSFEAWISSNSVQFPSLWKLITSNCKHSWSASRVSALYLIALVQSASENHHLLYYWQALNRLLSRYVITSSPFSLFWGKWASQQLLSGTSVERKIFQPQSMFNATYICWEEFCVQEFLCILSAPLNIQHEQSKKKKFKSCRMLNYPATTWPFCVAQSQSVEWQVFYISALFCKTCW